MIKGNLVWIFLVFSFCAIGQSFDPDSIQYITPAEEAFMMDKESKSLLKVDLRQDPFGGSGIVGAAFEKKLGTDMSLSGIVNYSDGWQVGGELRYYHRMKNRIEQGIQENNVSGNYFHLQYLNGIATNNNSFVERRWSAGYGIQRRVLNNYFLDYKLSVDYSNNIFEGNSINNSLNLASRATVGLGFGKRHQLSSNALCPILKCSIDKTSLFKINFNNALNIGINNLGESGGSWFGVSVNPDIDYEFKLGGSSWSFNQNVDFAYRRVGDGNFFQYRSAHLELKSGVRYYHSLRKKIEAGKSGNNLNGGYFLARGRYQVAETKFRTFTFSSGSQPVIGGFEKQKINSGFMEIGYGYQSVLLEKFYVDIAIGWVNGIHNNLEVGNSGESIFLDLKAGFAF